MERKRYRRITAGVLAIALLATLPGMDNIKVFAEQKTAERQGVNELIVSSTSESFDTFGAMDCISIGDGLYVLSYADEAGVENAHKNYQQMEGILFADKNITVTVQTEETISSDTKENESEQTVPEDEQDKEDDSVKKKNDMEVEDLSSENNKNSSNKDETEPLDTELEENTADIPKEQTEDGILRIAVVDTGIDENVANLAPYITDIGVNVSESGEAGSTSDDNGHGTAMAQVIVSALEENGRNSDSVKLLPIKALGADGNGTILSAYQGIKTAIEQKADIICLGFSAKGESKLLEQAVNMAYEQGISVIAPAGNDNEDISAYIPGCYEKAVVVGNAKNKSEADNSNYGDTVDFAAYGTKEVISLSGGTQTVKGTSVSCAYVSGVDASFQKGLSCEESEAGLTQGAVRAENESLKAYFGKGIIGDVPEKEGAKESKTEKADEKTPDKNEDKTGEAQEAAKENVESDKKAEKTNETEYVLPGVLAKPEKLCKKESSIKDEITALDMKTFGDSNAYYTDITVDASGMSAGNGYHWEKDGTPFPCYHNVNDSHPRGYLKTTIAKLNPTDGELRASIITSGISTTPVVEIIDDSSVEMSTSINASAVSKWSLYATTPELGYRLLANPYKCAQGGCSWAGYSTYYYDFSRCTYTGQVLLIGTGTTYWHCSKSANPTTNRSETFEHKHFVQKYKKVKNWSTIYYNAKGGSIADEVYKNGNSYYKLNSDDTVVCSGKKKGEYTAKASSVIYGEKLNLIKASSFNITRKGYHLVSEKEWYATIGGKRVYFNQKTAYAASKLFPDIATKTGETLTLYANWEKNQSTLNVNPNGGKWNNYTSTKSYKKAYNDTLSIPVPTITNYKVNFNGNGGDADASQKTTNRDFSKWTKSSTFYGTLPSTTKKTTYTFGATADVTSTITATWEGSYKIILPGASRTGYDFLGWSTNKNATTADPGHTAGEKVTVSKNQTLYAVWKIKTYNITYHKNDGTNEKKTETKTYGKDYTIKEMFTRDGYDFVGWSVKADETADETYAPGKKYKEDKALDLYAVWKENYKVAYIGNGQTKGSDFIDEGEGRLGHSEKEDYTFDGNTQKSGTEPNLSFAYTLGQANTKESLKQANEQFSKEETITYVDEQTNREENTYTQKIEGTVVGWKFKEEKIKYSLEKALLGKKVVDDSKYYNNLTFDSPNDDYGQFKEDILTTRKHIYGNMETLVLPQFGAGNNKDTYGATPYVNLYADWDMGPKIESYDRYYTLDEAQRGFITEDELLNTAKATDEELISVSNTEGVLKNHEDTENGTSFEVWDYDADLFKELTGSCMISQMYRAKDAAGNVTEQMINVHIVDGTDTIIDGHDIGVDPDKGEVRFISEKYLHTIAEQNPDSIWVRNEEYKQVLEETVKIKRVNPRRSEPVGLLKAFGDKYTIPIAGTGTWTKEPQFVWEFTRAEIDEVKAFIEEHGPSNYMEEDALDKFIAEF